MVDAGSGLRTGKIAVTGADGFVGKALCAFLEVRRVPLLRLVRRSSGPGQDRRVVGDLETSRMLDSALTGTEAVVHLAGRAHVLRETASDPAQAFRLANVDASQNLAAAASRAGVRRLVFVSSIGVLGTQTRGEPFTEADIPAPTEDYAVSKLEAEQKLSAFCASNKLELVIVRPPLVYGPGVAGNFRRLIKLAASGLPLPIGRIRNRRNLIGVQNLAHFLHLCATHPAAASETFVICEPQSYSTPALVAALAQALRRPNRIFDMPVSLLRFSARLAGLGREFERLAGSLEVSALKAARVLQWQPQVTFESEIARIAAAYEGEQG